MTTKKLSVLDGLRADREAERWAHGPEGYECHCHLCEGIREIERLQRELRGQRVAAAVDEARAAHEPKLSYSQACDLLTRYAIALQDRQNCGDEMQPQYMAALKACTDAMGVSP